MANSALPHPAKVPKDGEAWMWYVIVWGLIAALFAGAILGALATYAVHSLTQKDPSATTTGVAGVAGAGIYYAFQATFTWRFWIKSYKDQSGNVKQRGRQNANNGGINVEVKGKNHNFTLAPPAPALAPTVVVMPSAPAVEAHKPKPGELRLESFEALGPNSRTCHGRFTNVGDRPTGVRELGITPLEHGATPGRVVLRPIKAIPEVAAQAPGTSLGAVMARAPPHAFAEALDAVPPGHTAEFYFEAPSDRYFMGGLDANVLRVEVVPRNGATTTAFLKCSPWQEDRLAHKVRSYSVQATEQDARAAQSTMPSRDHDPAAASPAIVGFSQSPAPAPTLPPAPETVLDKTIEVEKAALTWEILEVTKGDTLEGTIESDQPVSAYLMSEGDFIRFRSGNDEFSGWLLMDDEVATEVKWRSPKTARFRLVFDAKGKVNSREVTVFLRRKRAVVKARSSSRRPLNPLSRTPRC